MIAMMKRNLQLYFSSKASVFFSLLGALLAFVLYIVFLQKNLISSWETMPDAELILDQWVMSGTLAVTSITTTWTGVVRQVQDYEKRKLDDFLMTDTSLYALNMGYLFSSTIIGIMMQLVMFGVMSLYFYWQDALTVTLTSIIPLISIIVLSSFLHASLGLIAVQWIKKSEVAERISIIVGSLSGFLVGVYMPIGALPDAAQTVIKLTPGAYVAAAFRQIFIEDKVTTWQVPNLHVEEYLGMGINIGRLTSLQDNIVIISGILLVSLLALALVQYMKGTRIQKNN